MRIVSKFLLACAAVALAGSAALAAASPIIHHLTVRLPDGNVARVSYTGAVAPKVTVQPDEFQTRAFMPGVALWSPFAGMDRISAQMDAIATDLDYDMAIAMRQAGAMAVMPAGNFGNLTSAALEGMPAGSESYAFASSISGKNVCTREVQITRAGNDAAPKIVSHTSGNCAGANAPDTSAAAAGAPADRAPTIRAKERLAPTAAPRLHI